MKISGSAYTIILVKRVVGSMMPIMINTIILDRVDDSPRSRYD